MATQESPGGEQGVETLARQVRDLEQESAQLSAAISRARWIKVVLVLALVAIVLTAGVKIRNKALQFVQDPQPLYNELQTWARDNEDELQREAKKFIDDAVPPLRQAFQDRFEQDMPVIMDLVGEQREVLALALRDELEKRVQQKYQAAIASHQQILKDEFPDIKDQEAIDAMNVNMQEAIKPLVKRYYADKLALEFEKMQELIATFPLAPPGDRDKLAEDLYGHLFELMRMRLAHAEGSGATAKSKNEPGGGGY